MSVSSDCLFAIRDLHKLRHVAGTGFELYVPNFTIRPGEIMLVKGPSGSGKSTFLDILAMALKPDRAELFRFALQKRADVDVNDLWRQGDADELSRLRRQHIGYVLQTGGLMSFLTVRENIEFVCRLVGCMIQDKVEVLAEQLGIRAQLDKLPAQLSVGERQRATIARALVHRPKVVLADEPTASVDPVNAKRILRLFLDLVEQSGSTAIVASHDVKDIGGRELYALRHRIEKRGEVIRSFFWN